MNNQQLEILKNEYEMHVEYEEDDRVYLAGQYTTDYGNFGKILLNNEIDFVFEAENGLGIKKDALQKFLNDMHGV